MLHSIQGADVNAMAQKLQEFDAQVQTQLTGEDWKDIGNNYINRRQFADAINFYSLAVQRTSDNVALGTLHSNKSMAYLQLGNVARALQEANIAVAKRPEWGKAYLRKAKAEEALLWNKQADYTIARAIQQTNGSSDEATVQAAAESIRSNALINSYINSKNSNGSGNTSIKAKEQGNESFKKQQYDVAIEHYTKAIAKDIESKFSNGKDKHTSILWNNRGSAFMQMGEYEAAILDFNNSIEADSKLAKAYVRKAKCLKQLNRVNEAKEVIETALQSNPNNKELLEAKQEL